MLRTAVFIFLTSTCLATCVAWWWCRTWAGAIGSSEVRMGYVTLAHQQYGYDVVLKIGRTPPGSWRPTNRGEFHDFRWGIGSGYSWFSMPFWFVVVLLGSYPAVVLFKGWRRRTLALERRSRGLCANCGYDLTGATNAWCPECSEERADCPPSPRDITRLRIQRAIVAFVLLGMGYFLFLALLIFGIELVMGWGELPFTLTSMASIFLYELIGLACYGAMLGAVWAVCCVPILLLRRLELRQVMIPLTVVLALVAVASQILARTYAPFAELHPLLLNMLMPSVAVVLTCALLRRKSASL